MYLFAARIFRGGGDSDTEGLDLGVGLVLTLLAMPGGFVSLLLLNKYGTFLQWLRGNTHVDPLLVALPDEYFFIVLSMTVTGAVAVWRWDAIFPDRRDYMNLVPLPISTRTIFFANLVAVLFLVGLVAFDVNADVVHFVSHGRGCDAKQVPVLRKVCQWFMRSEFCWPAFSRSSLCSRYSASDGRTASARFKRCLGLRSRRGSRLPGRVALHHFRRSGRAVAALP